MQERRNSTANSAMELRPSILWIEILSPSCKTIIRWLPQNFTGDKSTLVQVMAWCRQATSHCLDQCCRCISPYGINRLHAMSQIFLSTHPAVGFSIFSQQCLGEYPFRWFPSCRFCQFSNTTGNADMSWINTYVNCVCFGGEFHKVVGWDLGSYTIR